MTSFEFATAQRIKFGSGSLRQLGGLTRGYGQRVALVTGGASLAANGRLAEIEDQFREAEVTWLQVQVAGEPTVDLIDRLAAGLAAFNPDVVVGIGGGSVLDTAKALAALLTNGGSALDYLEGVGRGATLSKPSLPCIAVPTTAGTGSEATRNAVIGDQAKNFKKSIRSATMLPALALVDPDLTQGCPSEIVAACGMDALTQLIEAYTSQRANPITDCLALQGIGLAAELPFLYANPQDAEAREAMALASLLGGICLANAGLGAVHGLAAALGAFFSIPHGIACAALLSPTLRMNISGALEQDQPGLIFKYSAVFEILAGNSSEDDDEGSEEGGLEEELELTNAIENTESTEWPRELESALEDEVASDDEIDLAIAADNAMQLVQFVADLKTGLKLPGLAAYGIGPGDFERIIAGSAGTSMQTNPVKLAPDDWARILEAAL